MEPGDGGDAAAAAAGEDRLSALPNDVLVLILRKLSTRAAAQTSVLSHRWRRVWALLPALSFASPPEPHRLRDVLDGHEVLLRDLLVGADGATTPEFLAVWLPAAARRVSGDLTLKTYGPVEYVMEEETAERGAFELPCFELATTVSFSLGFQGLAVPLAGIFARLTGLHLSCVWFHGPGELGDAVSSPRCPCLQRLTVESSRGLKDLAIQSESMLLLVLKDLALSQVTVVAPKLKELIVSFCFTMGSVIANISAPLLTKLVWDDEYDRSSVHLGKMAHLQYLGIPEYLAYGNMGVSLHNQACLSLLQRFEGIKSIFLTLVYPDVQSFCWSECECVELVEWETEELFLNHLEEVEINGWRGTEHEVAFVKRLFDWGPKLKEMTVNFFYSISEVKAKELYQIFQSFSRPGVCMKFYRYETDSKVFYAPQD